MKNETITISMDAEKLRAIRRYMGKKDTDLEQQLAEHLGRLYEKYVPANVREYIGGSDVCDEESTAPARKTREKSKPSQESAEPLSSAFRVNPED